MRSGLAPGAVRAQSGRDSIPGARRQRVCGCRRGLPRQAARSPGAGPAAHAVRYHERACVEAGARRVVSRHIRAALEGHPARLRDADVVQRRDGAWIAYALHSPVRSSSKNSRNRSTRRVCPRPRCSPPESRLWLTTPMSIAIHPAFCGGLWHWDLSPFARFR